MELRETRHSITISFSNVALWIICLHNLYIIDWVQSIYVKKAQFLAQAGYFEVFIVVCKEMYEQTLRITFKNSRNVSGFNVI